MAAAHSSHVFLCDHPEPLLPGLLAVRKGVASGLHFGVICMVHPLISADTHSCLRISTAGLLGAAERLEHLEEARKEQGGPGQQGPEGRKRDLERPARMCQSAQIPQGLVESRARPAVLLPVFQREQLQPGQQVGPLRWVLAY